MSTREKYKKSTRTNASTDGKKDSDIEQTIHFSAQIMLAESRATCSLLDKRNTEIIVDNASATTEPE